MNCYLLKSADGVIAPLHLLSFEEKPEVAVRRACGGVVIATDTEVVIAGRNPPCIHAVQPRHSVITCELVLSTSMLCCVDIHLLAVNE